MLVDDDHGVRAPGVAGCHGYLRYADVVRLSGNQARQVRLVHVLGVDEDEMTHAKAGQELGCQAAGTAETDDRDPDVGEYDLSGFAVHPGLPVPPVVA